MLAYIVRRILLTIPIVLGVVVITFVLFSVVAKDPARQYAGKIVTEEGLQAIRAKMQLNKPRWFDTKALREGRVTDRMIDERRVTRQTYEVERLIALGQHGRR